MMEIKDYFKKAEKQGWAIGQFNFSNLKTLEAIIRAGQAMKAPVIVGTSEGESKSIGLKQAVALVRAYRQETGLPIFLNLDHGKSFVYIKKAIDAGYDAVHFDGSELSLEKNIREARKVVEYAKKFKVLVEGEVGIIGKIKTESQDALKFVKEAKTDSLAVSVGNIHGIRKSGINPNLDLEKLKEIKKKIGDMPLVLHGGSGTPDIDVKRAIKLGVVKVNINTELRIAYTTNLRKELKLRPKEITPYKYMPKVVLAVQKIVENKIKLFGSTHKA